MDDSHERVFSKTAGVEVVPLGLYIIRGDNITVIAEIDDQMDKQIDFSAVKADPPNSLIH